MDESKIEIKGIGPKRLALLKELGISRLSDFLEYLPKSYLDYSACTFVEELQEGETASLSVTLTGKPSYFSKRGLTVLSCSAKDEKGKRIVLRFYNQPYRYSQLIERRRFIVSGKVKKPEKGPIFLINPLLTAEVQGIVPVYGTLKGLTQSNIRDGAAAALERCDIFETLPEELLQKQKLPNRREALRELHFPKTTDTLKNALRRKAFEEALYYFIAMDDVKEQRKTQNGIAFSKIDLNAFVEKLPFAPTDAQLRVLHEVQADMASSGPMNRMIQGDVGSGKTLIAVFALETAAAAGYQGVLLAPTEILARQHYETLKTYFGSRCGLLTGSMSAAEKRDALEKIASGQWAAVAGTHALLGEGVIFQRLGLAVTDEQHRFGVEQRAKILYKGSRMDVLVMSATPIPRTLSLILYGDLDISLIDQLPAGRQRILTHLVSPQRRKDLYLYLAKLAKNGQQSYVVCPLIEKTEGLEGLSAEEVQEELQSLLPDVSIGLLHGRMKEEEKQAVMGKFYRGQLSVLVSTTVIEVGVHVPKATAMVVEGAERFGLSSLHQLRGRVGRGSDQSHCFLVVYQQKKTAMERLNTLLETGDGFEIAQKDLLLRGAGDLLGIRQSGEGQAESLLQGCSEELLREAGKAARDVLQIPSESNNRLLQQAREKYLFLSHIALN